MADHDKFVLKEKQKLQEREKKLAKQEAEFERLREQNAALDADLKAKSAQLAQTADLLRKRDEERDAARREAAMARQALEAAKAEAAAAKAANAAAANEERKARDAAALLANAESEAAAQRSAATSAKERAEETRQMLDSTVAKLRETAEALNQKDAAVLGLGCWRLVA